LKNVPSVTGELLQKTLSARTTRAAVGRKIDEAKTLELINQ